jgi:hypothetical protein
VKDKQQYYFTVSPYNLRLKQWTEFVEAVEKHIKLGQALQAQGIEILKKAQGIDDSADVLGRLILQATAAIEKGTKIESDARDKLNELHLACPV